MKIIKFFTILITPLIVGIACCFILLKICNIHVGSVTNFLLAKIPLVNQFVETTSNTGLYAIKQIDKKELVTSSYNVDFLVSFYQSGKKTIILYPYVVEAGINLEYAEQKKQDSLTVITLPNAQITKATTDDTKKSNVIREQIDIASQYNNLIIPIKTALERRAKDLAISSGILQDANENARKYLSELFSGLPYKIQTEKTPQDSLKILLAPHLPVSFTYQDKNLSAGKLNCESDTIYHRDDLNFEEFKFGYLFNEYASFQETDSYIQNSDVLGLRIIDPLAPKENRIYAKASELYNKIMICCTDGSCYYMTGNVTADEKHIQKVAPDMLYLAMSCSNKGKEADSKYLKWIHEYENALNFIQKGQYQEASVLLQNMEALRNSATSSWEETLMRSLVKTKVDKMYHPTEGNDEIDLLLKAIYLFENKKYNEINDEFQTKLLALDDETWSFIKKNRHKLMQLFYQLDNTSQALRNNYKKRIIESALQYDHSIALSLKGQDYCDYMHGVMLNIDDEYTHYLTGGSHPNVRIIGHNENLDDDEFNGFDNICALMKKEKVLKDNEPQLVLAYISKSGPFTKNHNLIIFEKNQCTICSNITGKWQRKYTYTTTYDRIASNPINNSFTIGKYEYKGKAIAQLIQEIKNGIRGYKKDITLETFSKNLSNEISNDIYKYCIR